MFKSDRYVQLQLESRRLECHGRPTSTNRGHDLDRLASGGPLASFAEEQAAARGIRQAVRHGPAKRGEPDGQER
jgi:hypothetical protein